MLVPENAQNPTSCLGGVFGAKQSWATLAHLEPTRFSGGLDYDSLVSPAGLPLYSTHTRSKDLPTSVCHVMLLLVPACWLPGKLQTLRLRRKRVLLNTERTRTTTTHHSPPPFPQHHHRYPTITVLTDTLA